MKTTLALITALLLAPLAVSHVSAQTVAASQQQAMKKYPDLAVGGAERGILFDHAREAGGRDSGGCRSSDRRHDLYDLYIVSAISVQRKSG